MIAEPTLILSQKHAGFLKLKLSSTNRRKRSIQTFNFKGGNVVYDVRFFTMSLLASHVQHRGFIKGYLREQCDLGRSHTLIFRWEEQHFSRYLHVPLQPLYRRRQISSTVRTLPFC